MGDPECQTILPKLKTDFLDIIDACVNKKLNSINFEWKNKKSLCVVLCSKGYPEKSINNQEIKNLEKLSLKKDEFISIAFLQYKIAFSLSSNWLKIIPRLLYASV